MKLNLIFSIKLFGFHILSFYWVIDILDMKYVVIPFSKFLQFYVIEFRSLVIILRALIANGPFLDKVKVLSQGIYEIIVTEYGRYVLRLHIWM